MKCMIDLEYRTENGYIQFFKMTLTPELAIAIRTIGKEARAHGLFACFETMKNTRGDYRVSITFGSAPDDIVTTPGYQKAIWNNIGVCTLVYRNHVYRDVAVDRFGKRPVRIATAMDGNPRHFYDTPEDRSAYRHLELEWNREGYGLVESKKVGGIPFMMAIPKAC